MTHKISDISESTGALILIGFSQRDKQQNILIYPNAHLTGCAKLKKSDIFKLQEVVSDSGNRTVRRFYTPLA